MDISKKQTAIFYIEKNKGILYTANLKTPFVVEFSKDEVNNLGVIDKSKFEQLISNFIIKNELKPMNIFVVLTRDVTFEKELKDIPLSLQTAETEKFLEMVLFDQILAKTYNFNNKTIIVAANKDLCENIISAFQENLFSVLGILPLSILEEKIPPNKKEYKTFVLKKIENLKQYFLPLGLEHPEKTITYNVPSLKNLQFVILIGIFALLLIILGVQVFDRISTSVSKSSQIKPVVTKQILPTLTSTASPSATLTPKESPIIPVPR